MQNRTIGEILETPQDVVRLAAATSIGQAAQAMAGRHIGSVLVCEGERLLGIFTERDVLERVVAAGRDPDQTTLADIMTPEPVSVTTETTVLDALKIMKERRVRHLPVLGEDRIVGIVSVRDLLVAMIAEFAKAPEFPREFWEGFEGIPV